MRTFPSKHRAVDSVDGAGVRLKRIFGYNERTLFDPFLLLDHFGSDNPADYTAGFPWHPHRGIETVTYLLKGEVAHGDSLGNSGVIRPGDAQWMTAGSGIIHQEMPRPGTGGGSMFGFQLWVNLPAALKMTDPRYRSVDSGEVPLIEKAGSKISVLAGSFEGQHGATPDLYVPVLYLVVEMDPGAELSFEINTDFNAAAYVWEGSLRSGGDSLAAGTLGRLAPGDADIHFEADPKAGSRFVFFAGKPLNEPIAWGGPIVMNTRKELETAFAEYHAGTFIRKQPAR